VVLTASFVRRRPGRDRVYVTRGDGTSLSWDFPSYGDGLPHDLCHLVVEGSLGLTNGFWGLVDRGMAVTLIANQPTLVRQGRPLVDDPGVDFSDLIRAEEAVARLGPLAPATDTVVATTPAAASLTVPADEAGVEEIRRRLRDFGRRWRALDDGQALLLTFGRPAPNPSTAADAATTRSVDRRRFPHR
jgi:hypothetical protein